MAEENAYQTPLYIPPPALPNLSQEEIDTVTAALLVQDSDFDIQVSLDYQSYRDVVQAVDVWISENMLGVDNQIPQPGRSELSMQQKGRVFFAVVQAKIGTF